MRAADPNRDTSAIQVRHIIPFGDKIYYISVLIRFYPCYIKNGALDKLYPQGVRVCRDESFSHTGKKEHSSQRTLRLCERKD